MMDERMKELERRSRAAFDESVDSLDAATRSRLARSRALALEAMRHRHAAWSSNWLPVGVAAAAALVAVLVWRGDEAPAPGANPELVAFEDLDIVAGGDDLDMLEEDEGFYAWAAEEMADGVG